MEGKLYLKHELEQLNYKGEVIETIEGIYYIPKVSKLTGEVVPVNTFDLAHKIAEKYGWHLSPTENHLLYLEGKCNQVPVAYKFISTGGDAEFEYQGKTITFLGKELEK